MNNQEIKKITEVKSRKKFLELSKSIPNKDLQRYNKMILEGYPDNSIDKIKLRFTHLTERSHYEQ